VSGTHFRSHWNSSLEQTIDLKLIIASFLSITRLGVDLIQIYNTCRLSISTICFIARKNTISDSVTNLYFNLKKLYFWKLSKDFILFYLLNKRFTQRLEIQVKSGQWNSSLAHALPKARLTQTVGSVESGYCLQSKTDDSSRVAGIYLKVNWNWRQMNLFFI
jgi:hypothetical protein